MGDPELVISAAHRFSPASPDEDIVHGACSPGWHSAGDHRTAVEQWVEAMRESGIERVCCLLSGQRLSAGDANLGLYRRAFGGGNVLHVPVPPRHLVVLETLQSDILPFLCDAVSQREPVVVHCLTGLGRTGQVLAAWLVAGRGYSPRGAVETVRKTGRSPMASLEHSDATRRDLLALLHRLADNAG